MAAIDELVRQIPDNVLRQRIADEIKQLSQNKKFGLVFDEHLPECTPLYGIKIRKNIFATDRTGGEIKDVYAILKVKNGIATCRHKVTGEISEKDVDSLVAVAQLGEPIFPVLHPVDHVQNAPDSSLWHTLIEADNYHALQLLEYLYAGKVDCIYIDPPYNTGTDEWKYNDAFVDATDRWSHSKWLSFIKKRLQVSKKLLSEKGSLIISIGYQEVHRLVLLCEELFPERQVVPITVQTSGGKPSGGFKYLHEHLVFVVPTDFKAHPIQFVSGNTNAAFHGMTLASFTQDQRPNQVYPIFCEKETGKVVGCGKSLQERVNDSSYTGNLADFIYDYEETPEGCVAVWPVSTKGAQCIWRLIPSRFMKDLKKGYIRVQPQKPGKNKNEFSIQFLSAGIIKRVEKGEFPDIEYDDINGTISLQKYESEGAEIPTIWTEKDFYTSKGTSQIQDIFGNKEFPYPKPISLILETLRACTNKDSLVVDFFAGSGTTLHAVNLLNAQDELNRRCIIITNNELSKKQTKALKKAGVLPGSREWEEKGICQSVTWPRTRNTILGKRPDGEPLPGKYAILGDDEERNMADGLEANVAYFRLGFVDKNSVTLGRQFRQILPLLWMKAGAYGRCPTVNSDTEPSMLILPENRLAILVDDTRFAEFETAVRNETEIDTFFFVTDFEGAYKEMAAAFPGKESHQLYREYIENFVIGARRI